MQSDQVWTIERLERLLDAYGADFARWPEGAASGLEAFLAREAIARSLVAEARALDRLLAMQPAADPGQMAGLADRIVAQAGKRSPAAADNVVTWPGPRAKAAAATASGAPTRGQLRSVAGLLAASLVLGFCLGATGLTRPPLGGGAAVAGLDADAELALSALGLEGGDGSEEDTP
jgi:hypothetical protein